MKDLSTLPTPSFGSPKALSADLITIYVLFVFRQGLIGLFSLYFPTMAPTVKTRPTLRALQEDGRYEASDPVFLLRNEHSMLLGKLRLVEQGEKDPGAVKGLLQTIIRDSEVHFKREAFLLRALADKPEFGGRSFHRLIIEHQTLLNMARHLLDTSVSVSGNSEDWDCPGQQYGEFARKFRDHIHHVEKVVYLLARTRLSREHQKQLAKQILTV